MFRFSLGNMDGLDISLVCPTEPNEDNPINLMKDVDTYNIELSHNDNILADLTVPEFLAFARLIAMTRFTVEMAVGNLCHECAMLLFPSVMGELHDYHTKMLDIDERDHPVH